MPSSAEPTAARRCAFEVLRRTFEHGAWTDRALRSAAERHGLEGRDRAFAQRLAYGSVQRRGTSDHLAELLMKRQVAELDPPLAAALRLGLYELLFTAADDHAAVGEAVELAKGGMRAGARPERSEGAAGLVNAVLRRAARERAELLASLTDESPEAAAVAYSQPLWIARRWWEELGPDGARALMRAMNEPAEQALRINTLRTSSPALLAALREEGDGAVEGPDAADELLAPPEALVTAGAWGPALRARIAAGELLAQSRASQAVVALLDPRPGERVLDLCAGPGIKSTQIAARLENKGEVRALELDPARGAQVAELAERTGASCVRVVVGDAASADLGEGYDRVLVDPPCTDLGTLASRPDARWRKTADQSDRVAGLQQELLGRAGAALRPGGTLVYSTCTISLRENEGVVTRALEADDRLEADDLGSVHQRLASTHDGRFLQTRPDRDRTAGFFMARLRRAGG